MTMIGTVTMTEIMIVTMIAIRPGVQGSRPASGSPASPRSPDGLLFAGWVEGWGRETRGQTGRTPVLFPTREIDRLVALPKTAAFAVLG